MRVPLKRWPRVIALVVTLSWLVCGAGRGSAQITGYGTAFPDSRFVTFIPHFVTGGGFVTRVLIKSLAHDHDWLDIRFLSQDGQVVNFQGVNVTAGQSIELTSGENNRSAHQFTSWMAIGSDEPISVSALFDCCAAGSPVTSAVDVPAQAEPTDTSFTAPFIFQRETDEQPLLVQGMAIGNHSVLSYSANRVTIRLLDQDGRDVSSDTLTIPGFGQTAFTVTELPNLNAQLAGKDRFLGSLEITGSGLFASVVVGNLGGQLFSLPVTSSAAATTSAIIPHFVTGGGYVTRVFVKNLGNAENKVSLVLVNQDGTVAGTETVRLSPKQIVERTSGEAARSAPSSIQWMGIFATQPILAAALFDCCAAGNQVTSAVGVLAQDPGISFSAPFVFQRNGIPDLPAFVQGLAIANRSNRGNTVTIQLLDQAGTPVSSDTLAALPASGQTALMVSTLPNVSDFLTGKDTFLGSLVISSAQPFVPIVVGNLGGRLLSLPVQSLDSGGCAFVIFPCDI